MNHNKIIKFMIRLHYSYPVFSHIQLICIHSEVSNSRHSYTVPKWNWDKSGKAHTNTCPSHKAVFIVSDDFKVHKQRVYGMVSSSFVLSESAALLTRILSTRRQEKEKKPSSIRKSNMKKKKTTTPTSN